MQLVWQQLEAFWLGLVAPGYEQAYVVACAIADQPARYTGSISVTSLIAAGYPIFSMGDIRDSQWQRGDPIFYDQEKGIYRKLIIERDRPIGVIALGEWSEIPRLREMVYNRRRLMPWQILRFQRTGRLWRDGGNLDLLSWPASATLCNCTGISMARLQRELSKGARSIEELGNSTGAGSVCGTCKPLITRLIICTQLENEGDLHWLPGVSLLIAVLVLIYLLPIESGYNSSAQDLLPRDQFWKQLTGYTLGVLSLILGLLILTRHIPNFTWGSFSGWKIFHILLGLFTTAVLILHTGMRMGHEFDFLLMLNFTGLLLSGALIGSVNGFGRWFPVGWIRRTRCLLMRTHMLLFWPLPFLIVLHIARTYFI